MHRNTKFASLFTTCALSMGVVVALSLSAPAGAAVAPHKAATGTVSCSGTQGSITFSPPLTPTGTAKEKKVTVKVTTFGSCTDQSSNPVTVKKTVVAVKLAKGSTASCASFASNTANDSIKLTLSYTTKGVSSTNISFAAGSITAVTSPNVGFTATGGTAKGSYAGAASFGIFLSSSSGSALAACIGGAGSVSNAQIASGTATF